MTKYKDFSKNAYLVPRFMQYSIHIKKLVDYEINIFILNVRYLHTPHI